jgi:hypothetical protein
MDKRLHRLKVEYAAHGVRAFDAMSRGDLGMLLLVKRLELEQVSERDICGKGEAVNVPLKLLLENDCRLIAGALRAEKGKADPGIDR